MSCGKPSCNAGHCSTYGGEHQQAPIVNYADLRRRQPLDPTICVKCKINDAVVGGAGGGDDGRFCPECFRGYIFGKFRLAVTSNAMILPTDKVLVAFSAGACSRVALQFVHEMQEKAQKNLNASRDKSLPVFGVGIAFIDESSARCVPADEVGEAIQHIKTVVGSLTPPEKDFFVAPLESIYSLDSADARGRLGELLATVTDHTGKDDLVTLLRMLCLQKLALENGYNKLVLGSCTSSIARHVIAATVKGQGYSLPADIQYVDARWQVPVLLPLRDCLAQELNTLCHLDGLKTLSTVNGPQSGINALVSSFITLLQEENPSRECTIVRTAGKLIPFSFNKLPVFDDPKAHLTTQKRERKFNIKSNESTAPESFCSLCCSPLYKSDSSLGSSVGEEQNAGGFGATSCSSCRGQILPGDPSHMIQFYSLLPKAIIARQAVSSNSYVQRKLRESIQDFLLSDDVDGS